MLPHLVSGSDKFTLDIQNKLYIFTIGVVNNEPVRQLERLGTINKSLTFVTTDGVPLQYFFFIQVQRPSQNIYHPVYPLSYSVLY